MLQVRRAAEAAAEFAEASAEQVAAAVSNRRPTAGTCTGRPPPAGPSSGDEIGVRKKQSTTYTVVRTLRIQMARTCATQSSSPSACPPWTAPACSARLASACARAPGQYSNSGTIRTEARTRASAPARAGEAHHLLV
jgi:hypothetical protein